MVSLAKVSLSLNHYHPYDNQQFSRTTWSLLPLFREPKWWTRTAPSVVTWTWRPLCFLGEACVLWIHLQRRRLAKLGWFPGLKFWFTLPPTRSTTWPADCDLYLFHSGRNQLSTFDHEGIIRYLRYFFLSKRVKLTLQNINNSIFLSR